MKIEVDKGTLICKSVCPFSMKCANHATAGDYRSESGFSPELFEENSLVFCRTREAEIDTTIENETLPVGYEDLGEGMLYLGKGGVIMRYNIDGRNTKYRRPKGR